MTAKQIGTAIRALGPGIAGLTENLVLIAGASLIAYGSWEAYRPAGPIVLGALLITGVILRARGS